MQCIRRGRNGAMSSDLEKKYHWMNAIIKGPSQYQVFHVESGDSQRQIVKGEYRDVSDKTLSAAHPELQK